MNSPPWCLTGPYLPSPLSCVRSLTATFVSKGKSTACSARLDYMKSKIWSIIACKLTGKSRWQCTECGSRESSRSHCPGLRGAEVSMFTPFSWLSCVVVRYETRVRCWLLCRANEKSVCGPDALLSGLWGHSKCPEVTWRMADPCCFRTWNACLFDLVSSSHVPFELNYWYKAYSFGKCNLSIFFRSGKNCLLYYWVW